jgi:hypothetical protein
MSDVPMRELTVWYSGFDLETERDAFAAHDQIVELLESVGLKFEGAYDGPMEDAQECEPIADWPEPDPDKDSRFVR